jgi:hypothetical protein
VGSWLVAALNEVLEFSMGFYIWQEMDNRIGNLFYNFILTWYYCVEEDNLGSNEMSRDTKC